MLVFFSLMSTFRVTQTALWKSIGTFKISNRQENQSISAEAPPFFLLSLSCLLWHFYHILMRCVGFWFLANKLVSRHHILDIYSMWRHTCMFRLVGDTSNWQPTLPWFLWLHCEKWYGIIRRNCRNSFFALDIHFCAGHTWKRLLISIKNALARLRTLDITVHFEGGN